jgi:hypothetical protein
MVIFHGELLNNQRVISIKNYWYMLTSIDICKYLIYVNHLISINISLVIAY